MTQESSMGTSTATFTSHAGLLTQQASNQAQYYFHGLWLLSSVNGNTITKQSMHETSSVTHDFPSPWPPTSKLSMICIYSPLSISSVRPSFSSSEPWMKSLLPFACEKWAVSWMCLCMQVQKSSRGSTWSAGDHSHSPVRHWQNLALAESGSSFAFQFHPCHFSSCAPDFWISPAIASLSFCSSVFPPIVLTLLLSLLKSFSSLKAQCKY